MTLNPTAVIFWAICSAVGYLLGDATGALLGFVIAASLSLIATLLGK